MAALTICSDFGAPQNEVSHCCHCFPVYLPWSDETGCHDLNFLNVGPQKKSYDQTRQHIKKQRHYLADKGPQIKAMVFAEFMYGCEGRTIEKAKPRRIEAFKLWCWRRLLRVLWTARRSNQSFVKEISPEYSLEGQMVKLKIQNFGHLMLRAY